jgi:1-acyl-sn-glycerol-3-phosphate acyltransferase
VASRLAAELSYRDAGHGYDVFGMHPRAVAAGIRLCRVAHRHYFRVRSSGLGHVPRQGAAILAANHSGMLPIDAAMVVTDVVLGTRPPRVPRAIGDVFIPLMPFIGTAFARTGMVIGSRANVRHLLETGELVLVFPEGVPGIAKGFSNRYQLADWRVGHAELALRYHVPVIPVAVVGAEEAWPQIGRIDRFHWFGAPFLPVPATPIPLPTRYHIHYGEPLQLHERWSPEHADDPEAVDQAALLVKNAVSELIEHALAERKGVFS